MNLGNVFEDVKRFHKTFGHPIGDQPQRLSEERKTARLSWMREELTEFEVAATLEDEVDAMIDELYFVLGTLAELGVDPEPVFEIVQEANMAKVWPDGTVHKNEQGKTIKPPGWADPFPKIQAEVNRQLAMVLGIQAGEICPICYGRIEDEGEYCGGDSCAADASDCL